MNRLIHAINTFARIKFWIFEFHHEWCALNLSQRIVFSKMFKKNQFSFDRVFLIFFLVVFIVYIKNYEVLNIWWNIKHLNIRIVQYIISRRAVYIWVLCNKRHDSSFKICLIIVVTCNFRKSRIWNWNIIIFNSRFL